MNLDLSNFEVFAAPSVKFFRGLMRGRFTKVFSFGLSLLASLVVVIAVGERFDIALAADDPNGAAKPTQNNPLEIPGSFKELADARDKITAKTSPERSDSLPFKEGKSSQLEIDAEKVPGRSPQTPTVSDDETLEFHATAYCLKGRTASGILAQPGVIAADPRVLPLGTVVHLRAGSYTGTYTVADTGGKIKGRRVDVFVHTRREAMQFGRRPVKIKIIGRGSRKSERTSRNLEALVK
jgi:3D (Asp-Asp-Asp) domain-containing protein